MVVFLDFAVAAVAYKMTATQLEFLSLRHESHEIVLQNELQALRNEIELKDMVQASSSGNHSCA